MDTEDMRIDPRLFVPTVSPLRNGSLDPTTRFSPSELVRATITPDGPGTLHVIVEPDGSVRSNSWGPGGSWLSERAHSLVGLHDDYHSGNSPQVDPQHAAVHKAMNAWNSLRLTSSHTPYHELLPAVLAQRITGAEAVSQWRQIVQNYGTDAPGPFEGLMLPPHPDVLSSLPYYELHRFGVEKKRADALRNVARHAEHLILNWDHHNKQQATLRLTQINGVGIWTAAVAGGIAFGDADALLIGDFHVKNTVAFALTGSIRGSDEQMCKTLAPYAGNRHRVVRWLELDGWSAPARGPRRRNLSIARL